MEQPQRSRRRNVIFGCLLILMAYMILSTDTKEYNEHMHKRNVRDRDDIENSNGFQGRWYEKADQIFEKEEGLVIMNVQHFSNVTQYIQVLFYDGDYTNDPLTVFEITDMHSTSAHVYAYEFNKTDYWLSRNLNWELNGDLQISKYQKTLRRMTGSLESPDCEFYIDYEVFELTTSQAVAGGSEYCFMVSGLSIIMIFALQRHRKMCMESESFAEKTSLGMLFFICSTDLWLFFTNFQFLVTNPLWFDYMIICALWSFFVYILTQVQIVSLVWRAQNHEIIENLGGVEYYFACSLFYTKFFIGTIFILYLFYFTLDWLEAVIFISFWFLFPQILRNTQTGFKYNMTNWVFLIVGNCRWLFMTYFYLYPSNFLQIGPNYWLLLGLALILVVQYIIMIVQQKRPRFLIPKRCRAQGYTYYQQLPDEGDENRECVIWMIPVNEDPNQRLMTTPCGHIFHEEWLMKWMEEKRKCPTCRATLPLPDDED